MARTERRHEARGHLHFAWDLLYRVLRFIGRQAGSFHKALGAYVVGGILLAVLGTWAFAKFAGRVEAGHTQAFDDAVMRWLATHRIAWLQQSLLEITALGTGLVVMTIVAVAALFLALTRHRWSALLLLVATAGGIILNNVLKLAFDRPRPRVFEWGTTAMSSSFPSGHAMSATVVYATVAYLAARLEKRRWQRVLTMLVAFLLIILVSASRLYLGVHYPSDVLGGTVIGLAWAGFCMAGMEAVRVFAKRFRPRELRHEENLEPHGRRAAGAAR
ncbi:MAG TPA: phosphatase PAP2 family protein [Gemmatimonadaceae bacterium]|nr:phosphatase PAP2 family protein [Gemmatimonadaceae bacterium]